jgi:hypothetical protein
VEWIEYFEENAANRRAIPWESGAGVTENELASIAKSLRAWQLGETSDGAHLTATARKYGASIGDPDFVDCIGLFIGEEQYHGAMLGRFLDLAGVERAHANWGDGIFRASRHAVSRMEVWATPVIMVETHAMIYYNAIRLATKSPVLRRICEQILSDEVPHIRFQCERLATLHRRRFRWLRALTMAFHRVMFAATTLAIWTGHRRALRAGGYNFGRFWRASWKRMGYAWRIMNPKAYAWPEKEKSGQRVNAEVEMMCS